MENKLKDMTLGQAIMALFALASGFVVTYFVLFGASLFLTAWAVQCLWTWYMVPLGLSKIIFVHALGISVLFSTLHSSPLYKDHTPYIWPLYFTPLLLLFVGWVFHFWMV